MSNDEITKKIIKGPISYRIKVKQLEYALLRARAELRHAEIRVKTCLECIEQAWVAYEATKEHII
jgi:hypothetical protein